MKVGDRVLIKSSANKNAVIQTAIKEKLFGTIQLMNYKYMKDMSQITLFNGIRDWLYDKELIVIEKAEYSKYEKIAEDYKGLAEKRLNILLKDIEKTPTKVLDFTHKEKKLQTNINFFSTGQIKEGGVFNVWENTFFEECAQNTKTSDDLCVYIPRIWVNHMGYSIVELKAWLRFLSKCEIGFAYTYDGIVKTPDDIIEEINEGDVYKDKYELGGFNKNTLKGEIVPLNNWYQVTIKGNEEMLTYLRYICLRYIFNHKYYSIPGTAMQIKKALGRKVTYLQALLMAHLRRNYDNYFSISNEYVNHNINPFQDTKIALRKLRDSEYDDYEDERDQDMNTAWEYSDKYSRKELDKFFKEQDWEGLFNYIKERNASTNIKK